MIFNVNAQVFSAPILNIFMIKGSRKKLFFFFSRTLTTQFLFLPYFHLHIFKTRIMSSVFFSTSPPLRSLLPHSNLTSPPPRPQIVSPLPDVFFFLSPLSSSSFTSSVALCSPTRSVSTFPCQPLLPFNPSSTEWPLCFVLGLKIKSVLRSYHQDLMSDAEGIKKKFAGLLMAGRSALCGIKQQGKKNTDDVF